MTSDVAAGATAEDALDPISRGRRGHAELVCVRDGARGCVEARDEFRDMSAPRLEAGAVFENEDEGLETFVFHVYGEAKLAGDAGLGDLFYVTDIDATLEAEDALGLLSYGGSLTKGGGARGKKPAEAALLLLDNANDRLLEEVDVEFAQQRVSAYAKEIEHLELTETCKWVTLPVYDAVAEIFGDAAKRRLGICLGGSCVDDIRRGQ